MNSVRNSKNGFTFIEVIVYVAVFSVIMLAALAFLFWAIRLHATTKATQETLENAERAMNQMLLEIRAAKSFYTPTASSTQLSLETSKYLPAGETSSFIDFFLCETRLCLKKESQSPVALTSDDVEITNLEFVEVATATSTPSMHITLTAEYKNPSSQSELEASVTLNSTASLRSY